MIGYIYQSEPAQGVDKVLIPGDPERARKAELLEKGIDIDDNSWADFLKAGEKAGLDEADIDAILTV